LMGRWCLWSQAEHNRCDTLYSEDFQPNKSSRKKGTKRGPRIDTDKIPRKGQGMRGERWEGRSFESSDMT
jgi:hypothetical protein